MHELAAEVLLGEGEIKLAAELRANGRTRILVDGVEVATGTAGGLITAQPNDPLIVGDDRMGAVGSYATPHPFGGTVVRASLMRVAASPR